MRRISTTAMVAIQLTLVSGSVARAQADGSSGTVVVQAGRPLRVALDARVTVKHVGQPITATVVEPVYAYDHIVIPAGTKVLGHMDRLEGPSKLQRVRRMLSGDFSPLHRPVLRFDTLVADDGHATTIDTCVGPGIENVKRQVARADAPTRDGVAAGARQRVTDEASQRVADVKDQVHETVATITQPGRWKRLREAVITRLPYHPQYLRNGTTYNAELLSPLAFDRTTAVDLAPDGMQPAPESVLHARLTTTLDSAKTPRGTPMEAVITEPVFSADRQLLLPEGTRISGEVTLARPARRLHRNGQLRFLFEHVQRPEGESSPLLASLHAVDVSRDDDVSVDEEGGAVVTNSKTRFIAPALAILALRGAVGRERRPDHDADDSGATGAVRQNDPGAQGLGGFLGFGVVGIGLSQLSHPLGVALAVVGVARTVYTNVLGKGKDVSFPAGTPIQVQLAPGPPREQQP